MSNKMQLFLENRICFLKKLNRTLWITCKLQRVRGMNLKEEFLEVACSK
jgi:hypothetical protein